MSSEIDDRDCAERLKNYASLSVSFFFLSRYGIFLAFAQRTSESRVVISYNDVRRNRWDSIELTPVGS